MLGLGGLLAIGAAVLLLRGQTDGALGRDDPAALPASAEAKARLPGAGAPSDQDAPQDALAVSADPLARARADAQTARARLREAREELRLAELALDDLEREVEAVEQFVENIEERGDDPARYGFEGMERLNPVIERYESRLAVVLAAERAVQAAEAQVELADAGLEAVESAAGER